MGILREKVGNTKTLKEYETLTREPVSPVLPSGSLADLVGRLTVLPVSAFARSPRDGSWARRAFRDLAIDGRLQVAGAYPETRGDLYHANICDLAGELGRAARRGIGRRAEPEIIRTHTDIGHSTFGHSGDFCGEVAQRLQPDDVTPVVLFVDDITGAAILEANARRIPGFALEVASPTRHGLHMIGIKVDQPTWTVHSSPLVQQAA